MVEKTNHRKLKVLMLHDSYSHLGGAEVLLNNTINDLTNKGHNVFLFSFGNQRIKEKNKLVIKESKYKFIRYLQGALINLNAYLKLKRVVGNFKPDVIHLHNIDKYILTLLLPLKKNNRVIRSIYDYGIICPSLWGIHKNDSKVCDQGIGFKCVCHKCINIFAFPIYYYLFKLKYFFQKKKVNCFSVATKRLKKCMQKQGFKNIFVSPYFTSKGSKNLVFPKSNNILFIGSLEKNKGCEYLIRAIKETIKKIPNAKLHIIGKGSQEQYLRSLSKKLDLNDNIEFLGEIPNKKIDKYYLKSSVVVVPSIWMENSPIVIYEALAFGKPVIATNRGGNPELIKDGKNGFVVEAMNSVQIANAIIKILKNKKLHKNLSENAFKSSKLFTFDNYIDNLERMYHNLLKH